MEEKEIFQKELSASLDALIILGKANFKERIELWLETHDDEIFLRVLERERGFNITMEIGDDGFIAFELNNITKDNVIEFCSHKICDTLERMAIRIISEE